MSKLALRVPAILLAVFLVGGCGGDGDATGPESGVSASESATLAEDVMGALEGALNSGSQPGAAAVPAAIPINVQYSNMAQCPLGGVISVSGSATGSIDAETGTGSIFVQVLESITDCRYAFGTSELEINGNPNLSATGTFTFVGGQMGTQQTVRVGGGFNWQRDPGGSGFCAVNLTVILNTVGGGASVSGTFCGHQMDFEV